MKTKKKLGIIEKFTANGLKFTRTFSDQTRSWTTLLETGDRFWILQYAGRWHWKCHSSEWVLLEAGDHIEAPAVAAIALKEAVQYFRSLASSLAYNPPKDSPAQL